MIYQSIQPHPALRGFVKEYFLLHFNFDGVQSMPIKPLLPMPEQYISFYPQEGIMCENIETGKIEKIPKISVFGQPTSKVYMSFTPNSDFMMFTVYFQPGALFRLLGLPLHEITNGIIDAELLISHEVREVNEQLGNAKNYELMVEIVESYLFRKLKTVKIDSHPIDKIGAILLQSPNRFSLDWLADQACLSARQFNRKFTERMGVGPKFYSRIVRFDQAFKFKETHPTIDWLTIALQFGYTDYHHLLKDFKQFGNITPNLLISESALSPEFLLNLK